MKKNIILGILLLSFLSCNQKEKSESIALREKQLLDKERQFAQKEAEYQSLLRMRDSIFNKKSSDSIIITQWPEDIAGSWSGKTICTESNCSDYVIGDQRNDIWEFSSDSTQLFTKIINNNNLVRLYSGKIQDKEIKLNFKTDSTAKKQVEMHVTLNDFSTNKIKGTRIITNENCTAKFSVELVRSSK